jgi:hypothetical protein
MRRTSHELWLALAAILVITLVYLFMVNWLGRVPGASEIYGHSMGILGFVLMLMTEVLYSVRKRSRQARWGRMSSWLSFHIFTGIVGPYLVLLHTSWKFQGVAGIVMLMTVIIVVSGFVGRYIYTAIPRTADGIEIEADELERQIGEIETRLRELNPGGQQLAPALADGSTGPAAIKVNPPASKSSRQLEDLLRRQKTLQRQVGSLAMARRMLATWHAVHIPIGLALFTLAFIHIGAAIYYSVLLY